MVEMMMGVEDVGERPAAFRQRLFHRFVLGGIDDGAKTRVGIADEVGVIIAQAGDEFDLKLGQGRVLRLAGMNSINLAPFVEPRLAPR